MNTEDLHFRIASVADFMDDLDAFSQDRQWPSPVQTDEDGQRFLPDHVHVQHLRIDFDYIADLVGVPGEYDDEGNQTSPPILRGPHMNIRLSLIRDTAEARAIMDQLAADIEDWFSHMTESDTETPKEMMDRLGITMGDIKRKQRKTGKPNGLFVDGNGRRAAPEDPKRRFAS